MRHFIPIPTAQSISCKHFCVSTQAVLQQQHLPFFFSRAVDSSSASSWTSAMSDLRRSGDPLSALLAFISMLRTGIRPDAFSLPVAILSAASLPHRLPFGSQLHLLGLISNLSNNPFVSSALIHFYSLSSLPSLARKVFDEIPAPNTVLFTALISGYMKNNLPHLAFSSFSDLLRQLGPSAIDVPAAVSALSACARVHERKAAKAAHGLLVKVGLEREVAVGNTLVDAYGKGGREIVMARKVFDEMGTARDVVSWNSMIALYAQNGIAEEALELYRSMLSNGGGEKCNAVTFSAVLHACAHAGALQTGKCVHDQVVRMGLEENVYVGTSVVDMYCKCGRVEMAWKAFKRIEQKNILSWSAIIAGYAVHGRGQDALDVFDELLKCGMQPNYITFVSVLTACSHAGLLEEGRRWLHVMKHEFGIEPGVEHYGCMVDLLGRAGCLDEAYRLIGTMVVKPDNVVWGALLSACRIHKNVELGEVAAGKLFQLDPGNCGYYVLLSNMYADANMWEDVDRIRIFIKQNRIEKPPGYSKVELRGRIHMFLIGDRRHPKHVEIYSYLRKLSVEMQEAGHVANTESALHDVDEEEKETALNVHSEKLAVAFAIISTPPGTAIHVIKNLRVCSDCHSAFKLIAKLVNREIVIRDSLRFHHFKDGRCSCNDSTKQN